MRNLFLNNRFFGLMGALILAFIGSFLLEGAFPVAKGLFFLAIFALSIDVVLLFNQKKLIECSRKLPKQFSLGDENRVQLFCCNRSNMKLGVELIEELPVQFQIRDFTRSFSLKKGQEKKLVYELRPVERGEYLFGMIILLLKSPLGLVARRVIIPAEQSIAVFPSIVQMKRLELMAFDRFSQIKGIKKMRRIGHSYEFEQIKNYVKGDDYRSINWKASGRKAGLMVNQYEDERAQQVYCVIDKSRAMLMPFDGMSLLDYSINSALALSNIVLQRHDRAGLISFSDKIGATIKADSHPSQLNKILQALYKEKERDLESNYELLYYLSRKLISGRSLFLLYTNFESQYALQRAMPVLRRINKFHLLVVVFFENTAIDTIAARPAKNIEEIYVQTIGQKYLHEKLQMVQELQQYGIQAIYTQPQHLSINTINKYLELKSRGLI